MNTCPVPHTQREQVWLGIGAAVGAATAIAVRRIWSARRLATSADAESKSTRCLPCEGLTEALASDVVAQKIQGRPLWSVTEEGRLERSFVAKNFQAALDFVNAVGVIAEREGHHPDLHITSYRTVTVQMYTHSLNGLTENDFVMASLIDALPVTYSPKWLREHPEAKAGQQ